MILCYSFVYKYADIIREKKKEANEKRRKFYKTEKGIFIKKMYKERMEMKKSLLYR